ncbi:MAG: glycosyltransferase family 39 protein [Cycloclasticus sp.]|nr:glycosyltransferase family 39 protein [Cycloclasticus sp.]
MALLFRVIGLNSGLWLDEIYSVVNQFRLSPVELFTTYVGDNQHPLYAVLASISVAALGEQPWVVRLPALIFGVASIPALYSLGRRVSSHNEALLAAALLAVSYHHVWFSQNARGYSAIALAAILCTDRFLCLLANQRKLDVGLYALIVALGCYAHLTMVFIVIGQFLVFLLWLLYLRDDVVHRQRWQLPLAAFVFSGLLTLLLYAPIFTQVVDYFVNKPSGMEELSTHSWALGEALRSLKIGWGGGAVLLGGGLMALVGTASFYKSNKIALGIFVCSVAVTFLVAFFARGTMYPRFFFFLAGFFILIGVRGVMVTVTFCAKFLFRSEKQQAYVRWLPIAAMLVVVSVSASSMVRNYKYPKMDFEGAKHWVEMQATPNDVIVTAGVAAWPYQIYYGVDWPEMKVANDIAHIRKHSDQLWMVYTFGRYMKKGSPEIYALIERECSEKKRFRGTLGGGDIVVCRFELVDKRS